MINKYKKNVEVEDEFDPELEIEGIGYGKKVGFDKASIVAEAVRICLNKGAVELRQGYTTYILDKFGNAFPKIIPDTRKEYVGSILGLTLLLRHEIQTYKEMKKDYEEFEKKIKEIKEKYIYQERKFILKRDSNEKLILNENGEATTDFILIPNGKKFS